MYSKIAVLQLWLNLHLEKFTVFQVVSVNKKRSEKIDPIAVEQLFHSSDSKINSKPLNRRNTFNSHMTIAALSI